MSDPKLNTFSGIDMPDLAELPLPSAVSLFPQTLAWKLLLLAIVLIIIGVSLFLYRRYQRRLWRRQAQSLAVNAERSARADEWFVLIRRVSRLHLPAEQFLALDEQQLLALLPSLPVNVQQAMLAQHYQRENTLAEADNAQFARAFDRWLKELPDV